MSRGTMGRGRGRAAALVGVALGAMVLVAGPTAAPLGALAKGGARLARAGSSVLACQAVTAALSDGPDASVDPVGYALAQIRPLRAIRTRDRALARAITALAEAYGRYYRAGGRGAGVHRDVRVALRRVERFCPGAEE